jgi:hypothetical protein
MIIGETMGQGPAEPMPGNSHSREVGVDGSRGPSRCPDS